MQRSLIILALVIAGEAAFLLPFVLPRIFRPVILDVFGLTNFQLGTAFSVYGIVAMAAYFLGGPLADRYPPRGMLMVALAATAAAGLVLLSSPSVGTLVVLYAAWGITTIALFWSPLIRATREWGGEDTQGTAFGLLDGGRGLLAAVVASAMVVVFASVLPDGAETASDAERAEALRQVILLLFAVTSGAALLVWFALPGEPAPGAQSSGWLGSIRSVMGLPTVWCQALIILCAYVGFKSTDDFALYASEVLDMDDVDSAVTGTLSIWVRPIAALAAGLLADRFGTIRLTLLSFLLLAVGSAGLAAGFIAPGNLTAFMAVILCASLGIFALRTLYYAIMQEGRIPFAHTGAAVGLVSLIGYTPDVFMGPLMGWLLDTWPGPTGHQLVFWVVCGFALAGLGATAAFHRVAR